MSGNAEQQTFVFADLAGFTALTEAHGDEQAADLVDEFSHSVRTLLGEHGGEQVKSIGDALLVRCDSADGAVGLGLCIVHDVADRHGFPSVRVGMHSGPAVERRGDWFGATVNTAARVAGLAGGGEVLLTEATQALAGDDRRISFQPHGRHELRNVAQPVRLYAALRSGTEMDSGRPIDPVCRMALDPGKAAGVLTHAGVEYHFCSLACVKSFASAPQSYAGEPDGSR